MGDDDETGADLGIEGEHQLIDPLRRMAIQVTGGLVRQDAGRTGHQCPGDGGALALAPGEFAGFVPAAMAETDLIQHLRGAGQGRDRRGSPDQQRHGDIFQGAEFGQQVVELIDEP